VHFMETANIERMSKALANETRLLILEAIASNEENTESAILTLCGLSPGTVSHHLKILSAAGPAPAGSYPPIHTPTTTVH
jgi:DNA-binding transcriptional ArsR family regulator